jgi:multidrug efflux pump
MVLSVLVALVLTPALCATILRPATEHAVSKGPFGWFNRAFDRTTEGYARATSGVLGRPRRFLAVFVVLVVGIGLLFTRLPSSFLPEEDQGILITVVNLPVGATQDRTERVLKEVSDHFLGNEKDAVEGVMTVSGFSFMGQGQNVGLAFVRLKDFTARKRADLAAHAVAGRAMGRFVRIRDAQVFALTPPAIQGMGSSSGFDFFLQDTIGAGHEKLIEMRNRILAAAAKNASLSGTRPNGQEDTPQFAIDVDQEKASALGISLSDIDTTLSTAWGSAYVNDFIDRGRVKSVYLQGDAPFRMQPSDLDRWFVRNGDGTMVPFAAVLSTRWTFGSPVSSATTGRRRWRSRALPPPACPPARRWTRSTA